MLGLCNIVGHKVVLTPFRTDLADAYGRWLADPWIQRMAGEQSASLEKVIARHRAWTECADFVEYIVVDRDTALPIGDVSLDFSRGPPRLGIMIGEPQFRGAGRAAEAVCLIAQFARKLGACSIVAEIYDFNDVSLRFHQRLGFSPVRHDTKNAQWIYEKHLARPSGDAGADEASLAK